jgi:integrase
VASVLLNEDIRKLEKACETLRDLLMVRLGYLYGPRRSELVLMEAPPRADLLAGRIRIPVLKRERDYWRWAPLDDRTKDLLREYIEGLKLKPGDRLFPITASHWTHRLAFLAQKAGIKPITPPDGSRKRQWGITPHRLRDFSVTARLTDPQVKESGLEGLKAVADFHGHKDPRSTLRYLKLADNWREEVFAAGMQELLAEEPNGNGKG